MKYIEYGHCKHHESAIQADEILLVRDQIAAPSLQQLDTPIHASNEDCHHTQARRCKQQLQIHREGLVKGVLLRGAVDTKQEDGSQDGENSDGGHLEEDTGHHDIGARLGVAVWRGRGVGCKATAYSLDDEGDDVAGAEDPQVPFGGDGGSVRALEADEPAEDNVDACCEEGGCWSS